MDARKRSARAAAPPGPRPPRTPAPPAAQARPPDLATAGRLQQGEVLARLGSSAAGLSDAEAGRRLAAHGPNVLPTQGALSLQVLARQLKSPFLLLLAGAGAISVYVGQHLDAAVILAIVSLSVGLGFLNEYRSERAVERLHARIRHRAVAIRGGRPASVDVTRLVPGDVVLLEVGDIVPADLRLLEVDGLECDEAVLSGEPLPVPKTAAVQTAADAYPLLPTCAYMGTLVRAGAGRGVVVATGPATAFGHIAAGLGHQATETAFQLGLRDFALLLVRLTAALTGANFLLNTLLHRPPLESALFALAVAVGLTPQLLPAIVTVSLSYGAARLAKRSVMVKRLVAIEDLGNVEVLFTDKTGTLTEGEARFAEALDPSGQPADGVLALGLLCNAAAVRDGVAVGGNPIDRALWQAPAARPALVQGFRRLDGLPFDFDRRLMSVLVEQPDGSRLMVTKGAPEAVLARCALPPPAARAVLEARFQAGARVLAVATRPLEGVAALRPDDERDLQLRGFLVFADPPKPGVAAAVRRLRRLGIQVKIVTGDNAHVAARVSAVLGIPVGRVLEGAAIEGMDDQALAEAIAATSVFARVTPDQKARIIHLQRRLGSDVGFLGDGVNDALALHEADVGISVDSAADVAKDAADIVLLDKDLGILAGGIAEGRRIFANTMKYVLMGTSSNFGNMFSAAGVSLLLPFLPMTPTQVLLNNLLYDVSEMAIPTDEVDEELLQRPARWDIGFVRRFMAVFGPISSAFDFVTFGAMWWLLDARGALFQTGWFVESLATQTLVIFAIRTRRVPFFRSRPSRALTLTSLACVAAAVAIPFTPAARLFGFTPLPAAFFALLGVTVAAYLALVEGGKALFFRLRPRRRGPVSRRLSGRHRRIRRRLALWSGRQRRPGPPR